LPGGASLAEDVESRRVMARPRPKMYFVYVLKSKVAKKSYVGITDSLKRRLVEHNSGKNFYTKRYKPWRLIYTEKFENREQARKREKYFKSAAGRRYLKKFIFKN